MKHTKFKTFTLLLICLFGNALISEAQHTNRDKIIDLIEYYKKDLTSVSSLAYLDTALVLAKGTSDTLYQAKICRRYGDYYYRTDKAKAALFYNRAKSLYTSINDTLMMGTCYFTLGYTHLKMRSLDSAKIYYQEAIRYYSIMDTPNQEVDLKGPIGASYNGLGIIAKEKGNYEGAIAKLLKSLDYIKFESGKGQVFVNIALLYKEIENDKLELEYLQKALAYLEEEESLSARSACYSNIGEFYSRKGKYDLAIPQMDEAIAIQKNLKDTFSLGISLNNLGALYYELKEYKKALETLNQVIGLCQDKVEMKTNLAFAKEHIGLIHTADGNCDKGIGLIKESVFLFNETANLRMKEQALLDLANSQAKCGDHKAAFLTQKDYFELYDTLRTEQKQNNVEELLTKYQTEKKEAENKILKQEKELQTTQIERRNYQLLATGLGILFLSGFLFLIWQTSQKRKQNNQILQSKNQLLSEQKEQLSKQKDQLIEQKEQIQLLNQELNHRVRNNLQLFSSLLGMQADWLKDQGAKDALQESQNRLQAMKSVYNKLNADEGNVKRNINLSEYLLDLCKYLEKIFSSEFQDLKINVESAEATVICDADKSTRIGLIVNELITNAVKYAFEKEQKPTVDVYLKSMTNKKLQLTIKDNGTGMLTDTTSAREDSLGTTLINLLVQHMEGEMQKRNNKGLEYIFTL